MTVDRTHSRSKGNPMKRFWHVGINVTDLDRSIV